MDTQSPFTAFRLFTGREEGLERQGRYSIFKTMWYRTNDLIHSRRIAWLMMDVLPYAELVYGTEFDPVKALLLAICHDDAEILTGDPQAGHKAIMTPEERALLKQKELRAIDTLSAGFPKMVEGYVYRDLLLEAAHPTSLEAQVMKWCDKFEGLAEAMHEVFAGHVRWAQPHEISQWGQPPTPFELYIPYLNAIDDETYPALEPLLATEHPLFATIPMIDFEAAAREGSPHTRASLAQPVGYAPYDIWRENFLRRASEEEIRNLYTPKEGPWASVNT